MVFNYLDDILTPIMEILAIVNGEYGRRHVRNIKANGPATWTLHVWEAPIALPPIIDYPEEHLPKILPHADLVLSFAENRGIAELLPEIAQMTGARAVLVGVDDAAWLPKGLEHQLHGWLKDMGVACATPRPLCSFTDHDYGISKRGRVSYEDPYLSAFAQFFGQPILDITVDPTTRTISHAEVRRDAVCGCARHVAAGLVGVHVDDAEEKAGLLHHHYPCLASMVKLDDFNHDTLMHASGHVVRDNVADQVRPFKQVRYFRPGTVSEGSEQ